MRTEYKRGVNARSNVWLMLWEASAIDANIMIV